MIKGGRINYEVIEKRKNEAEIIDEIIMIEQVKEKKQQLIAKQKEVAENEEDIRNKELLDLYDIIIEGTEEKQRKMRKKQAKKLRKAEHRK